MRFKAVVTVAAAGALSLPMMLAQVGCASNYDRPPPPSLPSARSDLGFVPNRLSPSAFRDFDRNHDGYLQRDEARGPLAQYFDDLDKDRDGKLSPAEVGLAPEQVGRK